MFGVVLRNNDLACMHMLECREGANVKGYFVWTLMDNMEVGAGYDVRFGLNYTDYYDNLKRYPKKSAKWFAQFLENAPDKKREH